MNTYQCDIMTCDEIARVYLPQVRAELVFRLVTERGISQVKVSKWMGITRAAVCQYISRKRGFGDIQISDELNEIINAWADGVITGEGSVTICDLCQCITKIKKNQNTVVKTSDRS
ncbi:putative transcriptional regulator [Methanomicrobium sp. W14]|uniref:transcriptional regulator n=1 Tax=Methanomicrobium sp. W14 TaxID=2817839 RepID=UPI001AE5A2CD|nr:transcriptional regulator [Methanomicrobium sp. W14]MBP2132549.1 putative transcriptional regulator [Methanomicrobium sp. W14]